MKIPYRHLILCAGLLGTLPALAASTPSVEQRLDKLEQQLQQVIHENAALKKELGYRTNAPVKLVKPAGKKNTIKLGGFIQLQGEFGNAPDPRFNGVQDRFLVRRARIGVSGSFLEHFNYKLQGDLSGSLGEKSGMRFKGTDLFVNWNRFDFANIEVGQFKAPFGYEKLTSCTKTLTIERSLASDYIAEPREVGVSLHGGVLVNRLQYNVAVVNGTSYDNNFNDNNAFMYVGRIQGTAWKTKWRGQDVRWTVGLDGLTTRDDGANGPGTVKKSGFGFTGKAFHGDRESWGVDSQFHVGRFDLQAEYLNAHFKPVNAVPAASFHSDGWYVMGAFYVIPKKLQGVARYESFDPDTSVAGNSTDEWTLGLNYYIKGQNLRLAANYLIGRRAAANGYPASDGQGRFLVRLQLKY